jgi:hypothetical protein
MDAGSTAVKQGQVSFCDATASHCTDINLLGTAQSNSAGKAEFYLRPGVGSYSYSYKAEFRGTAKGVVPYAGSVSRVLLHPECHDKVHQQRLSISKPRLPERGV